MAEESTKTLQLDAIELIDVSEVLCKDNQERISLRALKIFQSGRSWYESQGYEPKNKSYKAEIENLLAYKISDFKQELIAITDDKIESTSSRT